MGIFDLIGTTEGEPTHVMVRWVCRETNKYSGGPGPRWERWDIHCTNNRVYTTFDSAAADAAREVEERDEFVTIWWQETPNPNHFRKCVGFRLGTHDD